MWAVVTIYCRLSVAIDSQQPKCAPLTPMVVVPIVVIAVVGALAIGVYGDARRQEARGTSVVASLGSFFVDTPQAWFACCLFLSVVFVPLYLSARNP